MYNIYVYEYIRIGIQNFAFILCQENNLLNDLLK